MVRCGVVVRPEDGQITGKAVWVSVRSRIKTERSRTQKVYEGARVSWTLGSKPVEDAQCGSDCANHAVSLSSFDKRESC
jgi:hypothetical protein